MTTNSHPDWWTDRPRTLSVVVDNPSWILPYAERVVADANAGGDRAILCREHATIGADGVAFYLGCVRKAPPGVLAKNHRNLVVHESDLPRGRGFSPLTWQVLEGANDVPVCLIEAMEELDSGPIIYREALAFRGDELIDEMRGQVGELTVELCLRFLAEKSPPDGLPQTGKASNYARRRPADSRLDPLRPIVEQFDLLRIVDNDRYPAYFDFKGCRYRLRIDKWDPEEGDR